MVITEEKRRKWFQSLPPDEKYATCEYCRHYKGTHCEKHVRRNRVVERCSLYEFDAGRVPPKG